MSWECIIQMKENQMTHLLLDFEIKMENIRQEEKE